MFCKNCGVNLADGTKFCNACGTNQEGSGAAQSAGKTPKFEFKTVQCYPDNATENRYKAFYEDLGWQILDMDRKQVFERQDFEGTKHYSTQTHIKMQRDKNHPNYEKIAELSQQAEKLFNLKSPDPALYSKQKLSAGKLLAVGIFLWFLAPVIIPVMISKNKKKNKQIEIRNREFYEKETAEYNEKINIFKKLREECKQLAESA